MDKKEDQDKKEDPVSQLLSSLDEMSTRPLVEVMQGMQTLLVYASNLILYPDEKNTEKLRLQTSTIKKDSVIYQVRGLRWEPLATTKSVSICD
eukprot:TRINITY_DN5676_c0_g1_i1.p1 TRINITY_DN5676_c0_g1~~TRINITY_DN5676_c0_g1_i1.p1  ORF type:complete len:93 (-),score=8.65 TRINITY_DN5676_c0_g1_i1:148-426(-)